MKPYYQDSLCTIYHGDCREVLPSIEADVLVTDPPYGIGWRTPVSSLRPKSGMAVVGDDEPFDPVHLLRFRRAVIFGANNFAHLLPPSRGWFVWDKRYGMPGNDRGDAELAWTNVLGAIRIIRVLWNGGGSLLAENGPARAIHPTQRPLRLMRSVLEAVSEPGESVVDPYMGTGTTLRAAKDLGRYSIGIEIEERYCEIAAKRLSQETLGLDVA